jgi:tyrosyl-tRNA synthetase
MKNVIKTLTERGFFDQISSSELEPLANRPISCYVGFDPTAESLHLGNLVGIIALAWFLRHGHTPIVLLGGATGRIGDPSGKSIERPFLSEKALAHNVDVLTQFFHAILPGCKVVNNETWLGVMSMIDFLRDVGKHFRVTTMLAKESVRARIESEQGISYTEFSYQMLQAYDFHYLHQRLGVTLQMGGSDQWGNITAGIDYHRRVGEGTVFGATWPLIVRSDGKKFGKSEEGAIWLSPEKLSPYQFYQYLYTIPDADVIGLMKQLNFLELDEICEIEARMPSEKPNWAQARLAEEITRFVHGEEGLQSALRATKQMAPGKEASLSSVALEAIALEVPNVSLALDEVVDKKFTDVAVLSGLTPSKSEAVRLIKNGGAYLNNERIIDPSFSIDADHLIEGKFLLLSAGKKKRLLVRIIPLPPEWHPKGLN